MPKEGVTFADLARQAARALRDTLEHSALPLQQVVESAGVPRQPGVNPLFQVCSSSTTNHCLALLITYYLDTVWDGMLGTRQPGVTPLFRVCSNH